MFFNNTLSILHINKVDGRICLGVFREFRSVSSLSREIVNDRYSDARKILHWAALVLNKRIAGVCGYPTLIILVPRHQDVAFHSPVGPPGIFDQPVILPFICSISNDKNTMVKSSAAAGPESRWKMT